MIGGIAAAAVLTRLYPDIFVTSAGASPSRLAFPLTYYNALGAMCAVGIALALHCTAGARQGPITRILAAGSLPVLAVALYFTFSRGAIAAAAAGLVAYVVLGHPRRLPVALAATAVPVLLAVRAAYAADGLATSEFASFPGEARELATSLAVCALAAMALRALGLLADARLDRISVTSRARRHVLVAAALLGATAATAAAVAVDAPRRVEQRWQAVQQSDRTAPTGDLRDRLDGVNTNGRIRHWRVSLDAFAREPLTGTGAGTYRLEWDRERPTEQNVTDAHSLYLEVLGELGLPGLGLLVAGLLVPLGVASRRLLGAERTAHAAFVAGGLALLLHAGLDWDWEMPALFAWYFGGAGLVCAAHAERGWRWSPGRLTRVTAGLGCLLLMLAPVSVAASQRALDNGTAAFKRGDCAGAVDGALDSLDALGVRPEPFELLGYCNLRAGREDLAVRAFVSARARDTKDWQYAYGLAVAQALEGTTDPRPAARLARRLNPRDVRTRELAAALARGDGPRRWARAAARARIPFR